MRQHVDGLATLVWLPAGRARAVLVVRTPYDAAAHRPEARGWIARGVAVVVQDVRGRYGSPGGFEAYAGEADDGRRLLAWVRAQPWATGPVVLYGTSYGAHCAVGTTLAAAALDEPGPDGVVAVVPALGLGETARTRGGVLQLESRVGWWAAHAETRSARPPSPVDRCCAHLPVSAIGTRGRRPLTSWGRVLTARRQDDERARGVAGLDVPLLALGGTADWFAHDTLDLWRSWGGPARLVLGPWDHALRGAARAPRILAWLDALLAGAPPTGAEVLDRDGVATHLTAWPARRVVPLPGGSFVADPLRPVASPRIGTHELPAADPGSRLVVDLPTSEVRGMVGDVVVRVDAEPGPAAAPAHWCVSLARRHRDGTLTEVAHGAAAGPVVTLGPVALPDRDEPLALVVSAHSFPRYARDLQSGEDAVTGVAPRARRRVVHSLDLEVPA